MLIRFFEDLLINTFNGVADRKANKRFRRAKTPAAPPAFPPDYTVFGRILPELKTMEAPHADGTGRAGGLVGLSPEARMRHLYLLGATGTGKTNLLMRLIEADIRNRRGFCVIDLRGDLVDRILTRLAGVGRPESWRDRLLLLDLRDSEQAVGFNPLQGEGDMYNPRFTSSRFSRTSRIPGAYSWRKRSAIASSP